jgi:hypothetical protein
VVVTVVVMIVVVVVIVVVDGWGRDAVPSLYGVLVIPFVVVVSLP